MTDIGRHPNIIQVYGIGKLEGIVISYIFSDAKFTKTTSVINS